MRQRKKNNAVPDLKRHSIDVFKEFGIHNHLDTGNIYPNKTDPDTVEIYYLDKGKQEYILNDRTYEIFGGDIFIVFPDETHGVVKIPKGKNILYKMVLKRPREEKRYAGLNYTEAAKIFSRLSHLPQRLFKSSPEFKNLLRRIINIRFSDQDPLIKIELNNLMVALVLNIIYENEKATSRKRNERISGIIDYIEQNLFDTLDLDVLAGKCNLSLSRFKHLFKEEVGIPPSEFIIRKKMEKAQELLNENKLPIKEIAYDLGFSSPAYFSTVFKQYNGHPPTSQKKKSK